MSSKLIIKPRAKAYIVAAVLSSIVIIWGIIFAIKYQDLFFPILWLGIGLLLIFMTYLNLHKIELNDETLQYSAYGKTRSVKILDISKFSIGYPKTGLTGFRPTVGLIIYEKTSKEPLVVNLMVFNSFDIEKLLDHLS